jgi:hypothetical protein
LTQIVEAHRYMESNQQIGKIVVMDQRRFIRLEFISKRHDSFRRAIAQCVMNGPAPTLTDRPV